MAARRSDGDDRHMAQQKLKRPRGHSRGVLTSTRLLRSSISSIDCGPKLAVRIRTFYRAPELDEALAIGADPLASPELTLRAQQLVEPKSRRGLAATLQRVGDAAVRGEQPLAGPPIYEHAAVAANVGLLQALAARIQDRGPHALCGLAMADRLIRYGDSPLYRAGSAGALACTLRIVGDALEPGL